MLLIWTLSLLLGTVVGKVTYLCSAEGETVLNTFQEGL